MAGAMRLPDWLEPMAATLTADRFEGPEWSFERKFDGIRLLAYKRRAHVQLWSRNRLSLTEAYPAVARAIAALPVTDAIFDGEATGAWGRQGWTTIDLTAADKVTVVRALTAAWRSVAPKRLAASLKA